MKYHSILQFFVEILNVEMCANVIKTVNPLSSEEALQYFMIYYYLHNLKTQNNAAFLAALILSLQNLLKRTVHLLNPVLIHTSKKSSLLSDVWKQYLTLSYFVTLSCVTQVLSSVLWTIFWKLGINCNLASTWLSLILEIVDSLLESN